MFLNSSAKEFGFCFFFIEKILSCLVVDVVVFFVVVVDVVIGIILCHVFIFRTTNILYGLQISYNIFFFLHAEQ